MYPSQSTQALLAQAQSLEQSQAALAASLESAKSNGDRAVYSQAVCNRIAQEINNYTSWHGQVTSRIQTLTSAYHTNGVKGEEWRQSDERQANDLRTYAEQLNQQLTKLREDFSKCIALTIHCSGLSKSAFLPSAELKRLSCYYFIYDHGRDNQENLALAVSRYRKRPVKDAAEKLNEHASNGKVPI